VEESSEGFAQFVAARGRALQRTAWLLTGDWGIAEDLVQTALVRAWPRWERIHRRDQPELYVRKIILNTWLSWRQTKWRNEQATEHLPDGVVHGDMEGEITVRLAVRNALQSLTHRQRAVVVLRIFDDLPERQVADLLNCAVGTIKSTLSQALDKLCEDSQMASLIERESL
jgi:RNA polymerase sigma-70 factor (sigma-E family)